MQLNWCSKEIYSQYINAHIKKEQRSQINIKKFQCKQIGKKEQTKSKAIRKKNTVQPKAKINTTNERQATKPKFVSLKKLIKLTFV